MKDNGRLFSFCFCCFFSFPSCLTMAEGNLLIWIQQNLEGKNLNETRRSISITATLASTEVTWIPTSTIAGMHELRPLPWPTPCHRMLASMNWCDMHWKTNPKRSWKACVTLLGPSVFFVTGTVPSTKKIPNIAHDLEADSNRDYNRVSVPSHMWTAAYRVTLLRHHSQL